MINLQGHKNHHLADLSTNWYYLHSLCISQGSHQLRMLKDILPILLVLSWTHLEGIFFCRYSVPQRLVILIYTGISVFGFRLGTIAKKS